jgi:hypothetical protein
MPSAVVESLVAAILREHFGAAEVDDLACRVRFVTEQQARMPDYLQLPLTFLTRFFNAWPLLRHGRTFCHLGAAGQQQQLQAWRGSRLAVRRDLVRFYESLVLFDSVADRDA